jgi:peptidoglycan/xylan/chitin deacetylase (PgdA/CDA1 family)
MENFLCFPGFKMKALTLSYDDGVRDDKRLIEIMRKNGIKGTFNINSVNLSGSERCHSADEIKEFFGDDTEIAIHGFFHHSLAKTSHALAMRDVVCDRANIEKTFDRIVRGMAYANGSYNDWVIEMLRDAGIAYSRTVDSTGSFDLPDEWLAWHPTCHHNDPKLSELVEEFIKPIESQRFWRSKIKLFYLWGHSYEFPRDNNWEIIEDFCETMGKQKDIWFATNMEIYNYVEAFKRLIFASDLSYVENPSAIDIYIRFKEKNVVAKAGETVRLY